MCIDSLVDVSDSFEGEPGLFVDSFGVKIEGVE